MLEIQSVMLEIQSTMLEIQSTMLEIQSVMLEIQSVMLEIQSVMLEIQVFGAFRFDSLCSSVRSKRGLVNKHIKSPGYTCFIPFTSGFTT